MAYEGQGTKHMTKHTKRRQYSAMLFSAYLASHFTSSAHRWSTHPFTIQGCFSAYLPVRLHPLVSYKKYILEPARWRSEFFRPVQLEWTPGEGDSLIEKKWSKHHVFKMCHFKKHWHTRCHHAPELILSFSDPLSQSYLPFSLSSRCCCLFLDSPRYDRAMNTSLQPIRQQ